MTDSYKTKGLRAALIQQLRHKGITDEGVLAAMERVPRHFFLDSAFLSYAYQDRAFGIGEGQTISQPYTVAYQSSLLEVKKGDRILEIGTGSGYQSCILLEMGAKLYTIEYNRKLYDKAKYRLQSMGYQATCVHGDGSQGLAAAAPYDKILVSAAAPHVPQSLLGQLKVGGIMVIPVGERRETQQMYCIRHLPNGNFHTQVLEDFVFVPLLGKEGWQL